MKRPIENTIAGAIFVRCFDASKSIVEGLSLETFVRPDGLMLLLALINSGELPKVEILELAKGAQIPRYELTREDVTSGLNGAGKRSG